MVDFPDVFRSRACLERDIGSRCLKDYWLDELPEGVGLFGVISRKIVAFFVKWLLISFDCWMCFNKRIILFKFRGFNLCVRLSVFSLSSLLLMTVF